MTDKERLREVEAWFRERGITLKYGEVGDDEIHEWVALMVPDDHEGGLVEGGGGSTKLAAALDARERYEALDRATTARVSRLAVEVVVENVPPGSATAGGVPPTERIEAPSIVHDRALGLPDVASAPPEVREGVERAMEFGWVVGGVREPDGTLRWVITDLKQETILRTGVADTWDDALVELLDFLPPSGER